MYYLLRKRLLPVVKAYDHVVQSTAYWLPTIEPQGQYTAFTKKHWTVNPSQDSSYWRYVYNAVRTSSQKAEYPLWWMTYVTLSEHSYFNYLPVYLNFMTMTSQLITQSV